MAEESKIHKVTAAERKKRRGDRRIMALRELTKKPTTPAKLAASWHLHPSSAFRVLERLRAYWHVSRAGMGINAEYAITAKGLKRLDYERKKK